MRRAQYQSRKGGCASETYSQSYLPVLSSYPNQYRWGGGIKRGAFPTRRVLYSSFCSQRPGERFLRAAESFTLLCSTREHRQLVPFPLSSAIDSSSVHHHSLPPNTTCNCFPKLLMMSANTNLCTLSSLSPFLATDNFLSMPNATPSASAKRPSYAAIPLTLCLYVEKISWYVLKVYDARVSVASGTQSDRFSQQTVDYRYSEADRQPRSSYALVRLPRYCAQAHAVPLLTHCPPLLAVGHLRVGRRRHRDRDLACAPLHAQHRQLRLDHEKREGPREGTIHGEQQCDLDRCCACGLLIHGVGRCVLRESDPRPCTPREEVIEYRCGGADEKRVLWVLFGDLAPDALCLKQNRSCIPLR